MSSLSGLLRYCCKNLRWINEKPCTSILKLKKRPKKRRILTEEKELGLLKACQHSSHPYIFAITLIAQTSGARKNEVLGLTWDSIDFNNRLALIKDSKNGQPRHIGLVDTVIDELNKLRKCRNPQKPLVFASKTTFGKIDIKKAWHKVLKNEEIQAFVFHGLKHNLCSIEGELGASNTQLRAQLGHSSSRMTDHYSHLEANATHFIREPLIFST